jgi:hypothetical protein
MSSLYYVERRRKSVGRLHKIKFVDIMFDLKNKFIVSSIHSYTNIGVL